MKWIGITGSWRKTNPEVEADVRQAVRNIFQHSNGIVTGGALNVDSFVIDEALTSDPTARQIKVFIPTTLGTYSTHYRKRAQEGVILETQAESLISLLTKLKSANPKALIEDPDNEIIDKTTYYRRNQLVVDSSDELIAFQVNNSAGVQDTIEKARIKGISVKKHFYTIA
ncbi:MAG: hypothetical protein V1853_01190 [bacterium]